MKTTTTKSCIIYEYFKVRSNVLFIMKIDKKNLKNSQRCCKGLSMKFIEIFSKPNSSIQFTNSWFYVFLFIFFWFHRIEHVVIKNRHVICKERKTFQKNLKQKTKNCCKKNFPRDYFLPTLIFTINAIKTTKATWKKASKKTFTIYMEIYSNTSIALLKVVLVIGNEKKSFFRNKT